MKPFRMPHLLPLTAVLVALMAVGLGISASRQMPERVRVQDHFLRMSVQGEGRPSVILETSGLAYLETWNRIQPQIARFSRVVSYDHAGYWGSAPGPKPRDANRIARELRAALAKANVPPPYILVGYSFGGPYTRVFAGTHPDEIAGMILVDPTQEEFMAWLNVNFPELNRVTEKQRAEQDEWGSQWISMNQARDAELPDVPITVISGAATHDVLSRNLIPRWVDEHGKWASQYLSARHIITTNSGHGVVFTEPELIVGAVKEMHDRTKGK